MKEIEGQKSDDRVMVMTGNNVGLALMRAEDVPTIARWNQDLEFTARMGTPGEAHTLEMRQEFYKQNSRMKADSVEFSVLELSTSRLVGFGGLFDMTRAMVATMFVGIGEPDLRRKGMGTEASRLICDRDDSSRSVKGRQLGHCVGMAGVGDFQRLSTSEICMGIIGAMARIVRKRLKEQLCRCSVGKLRGYSPKSIEGFY